MGPRSAYHSRVPFLRTSAQSVLLFAIVAMSDRPTLAAGPDPKALEALASAWAKSRPKTKFDAWDPKVYRELTDRAKALGSIPEGALDATRDVFWRALRKEWKNFPKVEGKITTPYGDATWIQSGTGGRKSGLVLGLHGGGEGAGNASEAAGKWMLPDCLGIYPQGVKLVHDTWNTVHGERFILTLLELTKVREEIDPDRVFSLGFSMGGTGSWFMAGRHADLLAGAGPCAGVLMAGPKSQVMTKDEVKTLQHGFVPNVRNLAMYWFIGLADDHCMPGTYLYAWDRLLELKKADPDGYAHLVFSTTPGLGHAFPPGEPAHLLKWMAPQKRTALPEKIVWEMAETVFPEPEDDVDRRVGRLPKLDFYWLHCDRPVDRALVTATRKGNEFEVDPNTVDLRDLSIWLKPSMIDPSTDVVVRAAGREVYRGKPTPDVATVLESLDAKCDRTLTFDRRVHLAHE